VPETPLGDVAFNVGAGLPLQIERLGEKSGIVPEFTVMVTVSPIEFPQEFVAVSVNVIVPDAVIGKVKFVAKDALLEKLPIGAVQLTVV
jgi:hypothetical protein